MVQCLKCSTEFHKHEAKRKVSKTSKKGVIQNALGPNETSSSGKLCVKLCKFILIISNNN